MDFRQQKHTYMLDTSIIDYIMAACDGETKISYPDYLDYIEAEELSTDRLKIDDLTKENISAIEAKNREDSKAKHVTFKRQKI